MGRAVLLETEARLHVAERELGAVEIRADGVRGRFGPGERMVRALPSCPGGLVAGDAALGAEVVLGERGGRS